jgi:hypothetical protein
MSREPKKKPGEMAQKRVIHKQNQERRDALAKLRNGESIEIWAHYKLGSAKVTVQPYQPKTGDRVLCLFGRRLRVMYCANRRNHWELYDSDDPLNVKSDHSGIVPASQLFGVVTDILEVKESKS